LNKCKQSAIGGAVEEDAVPRVRFLRRPLQADEEGGLGADGTVWDLKWMISPELKGSFRSVAEVISNRDYLMFRACVGQTVAADGLRNIATGERVKQKQGIGVVRAPKLHHSTQFDAEVDDEGESGAMAEKKRKEKEMADRGKKRGETLPTITSYLQTSPEDQKSSYKNALNAGFFGAARLNASGSDDMVEQPALRFRFDASAGAQGADPAASRHLAINTEWVRRKIEVGEGEARLYMRNYPGMYITCQGSGTTQKYCVNEMGDLSNDGLPRSYDCAEMYRVIWCAKLIIWGSGIMESSPEFVLPFSRLDQQGTLLTVDLRRKRPEGLDARLSRETKRGEHDRSKPNAQHAAANGTTPYLYSLAFGKRADTEVMRSYNDETTGQAYYRERNTNGDLIDPFNGALLTWATREGLVRTSKVLSVAHESQTSYQLDDFEDAQAMDDAGCGSSAADKAIRVHKRIHQDSILSIGNNADGSDGPCQLMESRVVPTDFPIDRLTYTDSETAKLYLEGPKSRKKNGKQPVSKGIGQPVGREYV
jgi:hypothetical protein